ncbi:iron ABC transporter permease [Nocardioidaceae bacterium SCSIO 66511]|nr:iron ABC transporter permease [Nocardioidaceae bacterium SCSIO 66511]
MAGREPTLLVGLILTVLLLYLVVAPVVALLSDGFRVHYGDEGAAGAPAGEWTLYYAQRVFSSPISKLLLWEPLVNTLVAAVGVTILALLLGGGLAWLVSRTDLPGQRVLGTALIIPYMLPSWTFSLAWLAVFKNRRIGGQAGLMETVGFTPPDWLAYGRVPIIICLGVHYFPFAFLLVSNALRRVDSQLEESARILGAPRRVIARRIIIPLLLPALMSGVLLTFSRVIGTFGTPYVLGLPVDHTMLSTSLYQAFRQGSVGVMAVLAAVIVAIGVSILVADAWLLREHRRFVTVGTKGAMHRPVDLGRFRTPVVAGVWLVFGLTVIVPAGVLLLSTISRVPGDFSLDNFTLDFWFAEHIDHQDALPQGLLRSPEMIEATWNTLRIVGLAALVCGVLGLLIGYLVVRLAHTKIAQILRQVSFLPYLVPGIAFAAAYLSLFAVARGPIPALYGTFFLLLLVLVVQHIPYSSRSGISAMMQLGREPEEAAQICGAGWISRIGRIVIPIQKGALATAVILPFISTVKELSAVIMLATPGTELLTTLSVRLNDYAYTQAANGVVLVIAFIALVFTWMAQRIGRNTLDSGIGG